MPSSWNEVYLKFSLLDVRSSEIPILLYLHSTCRVRRSRSQCNFGLENEGILFSYIHAFDLTKIKRHLDISCHKGNAVDNAIV